MKSSVVLALLSFFGFSNFCYSQDHETIQSLSVNYSLPGIPVIDSSSVSVKVYPEAILNLVSDTNVVKIYFKIIKPEDLSIVYEVSYSINSGNILHQNGTLAFSKEGNSVHINGPDLITLVPYNYEIITENSSGQLSALFTEIH